MENKYAVKLLPRAYRDLDGIYDYIAETLTELSDTGNNFITFEIKSVEPIAVAKKYAGIGASIVARIKNTRTPFGIDFGDGDVIVPKEEKRTIPTQLNDFEAPVVNTYSVETTVSEKLDAILSLMEFSSRMKDYYDIYYLSYKFDFDGQTLREAIRKTFDNRNRAFSEDQFEQLMTFNSDDGMRRKWKAFTKKIKIKTEDYDEVLKTMHAFLYDVFCAAINNVDYTLHWNAAIGKWD